MLDLMWVFGGNVEGWLNQSTSASLKDTLVFFTSTLGSVRSANLINEEVAKVHYVEEKAFR
jgi:hypothetical protein